MSGESACALEPTREARANNATSSVRRLLKNETMAGTSEILKPPHNFTRPSLRAFEITETELRLIAAPATMGLRSSPNTG